ncbi:MAG: YebC/PmpR family DNA-binding transcriptional regulator [Clostridia bacterium]|jgi:YebC/PmpR family DNA-binding regulatory protein|nr:YebC/PmpR family DNA-binding transcriptional regulator [Clostridia bacterium]NLV34074.1 YebC/PmpR family DNA-binding transcriptional regulator [Clostridiaceae bacterium]MDD4501495.1 YebC/PmpR family DNA-binding transcriptional regulator [Clostridia bacterium]HPB16691.1 YebC/PmpR family DNA-binding transcriptional regulator [Clostridia bacterium]HQM95531.1 YebC/PmpR family DNA-binding transcriptional regulator [Clostridia bacterium]
MSGHSKWANIKHKKEKSDASRGKVFTKIGREIMVAVRSGGPDPNSNSRLRDVIAKAKANNVPNDTIAKSIKKASGEGNAESYEQITYEGYGPNGVAVIVEAMTDNRNRTASDVRHFFDKFGGNLGTNGCVSYLFDKKGVLIIEENAKIDADQLMMDALEAGAEDFENEDELYEITCDPTQFSSVREALEQKGYEFLEAEIQMIPQTYVKIDDDKIPSMEKLIDNLDDLDDVQNIYHNWDQE